MLFLLAPIASAGFGPVTVPGPGAPHGLYVVVATSLVARAAPRADAPPAYTLPIGEYTTLLAVEGGWARLDTGFFVDARFVAALSGPMEDALRQAREAAAADPTERATWDERIAAWQARSAELERQEAERLRLRGHYLTYSDPTGGNVLLAPPQQRPGEVIFELHPEATVPAEVWVLPQRGVARRGHVARHAVVTVDCGGLEVRDVVVEVDLGGERPIAFSTAVRPPESWLVDAPAQEHTDHASDEILGWLKPLANGQPLVVHTSELGGQRWIRAGFRSEGRIVEDWMRFDLVDLFVDPQGVAVRPFRTVVTLEPDVEAEIAQMMPSWYRDLDGDGAAEVLILSPCWTSATDLQGRHIVTTSTRCCGC